ncbi:DUF4132 domain-containing protein [Myceligenerans pegani]|uniref:DUF4132 domain-containing protein n=1 Tax=Myceligenerans pegani TaxID=2776917 RepID=A0ABR9MT33_9MICO|nr:DUF4132 domain-containing protein [Myceligenerans sp. TRM 65318]MBE1874191.1 DUF4132 domain-containing protein [Myceligenerans sp. TRM 65318]MBE3016463.1 DUF4132 domain-containing protein [Myceligenerans sp. TRM 65318]
MFQVVRDKVGRKDAAAAVSDALKVLRIEGDALHGRAVEYVLEGGSPELVLELEGRDTQDLDAALSRPGRLGWSWVTDELEKRVRKATSGLTVEKAARVRGKVYADDGVTPEQLSRLGRLLAVIVTDTDVYAAVPDWFGVLAQDVVLTRVGGREKNGPVWAPERLEEVARAGGLADDDAVAAVVQVLLARPREHYYSSRADLSAFLRAPGAAAYLAAHVGVVEAGTRRLGAPGKKAFCGFMTANGAPEALRGVLAALCADTAKGVRRAADDVVATLPGAEQVRLLAPLLETAPASALDDVVTRIVGAEGGVAAIEAALESLRAPDGRPARARDARAMVLGKAVDRAETLDAAEEQELEIPPYEPLHEAALGPEVLAAAIALRDRQLVQAREALTAVKAEHKDHGHGSNGQCWHVQHAKQRVGRLEGVDDDALTRLVEVLSGREAPTGPDSGKSARRFAHTAAWFLDNLSDVLPGATTLHLVRAVVAAHGRGEAGQRSNQLSWALRGRLHDVTDLRVLRDAFARSGVEDPDEMITGLVFRSWWGREIPVERTWPYFAERVGLLDTYLAPRDGYEYGNAPETVLAILDHFPVVPTALLPRLGALALGSGRTHRAAAQRVLARHPQARALAEQGLSDGKSAVRASAAAWLTNLGDKEAVPALRTALTTERREDVRAAFLTALEALGDDIGEHLSPRKLAAEAAKGLRKKAPVSMAWFPLDALPDLRWTDGTAVPREIVRWWVVLAVRLKEPSGEGLIARYVSLLDESSRAVLGSYVLRAWIAQDTRGPSAAESRGYAEQAARQRYDWAQQWLARDPKSSWAQEGAAVPLDEHHRRAYREHQATYLGSATKEKGLLALTVGMPGSDLATAAQHYFKAHPQRRSQADSLVRALAANGDRPAVQLLLAVSRQFKLRTVRETAEELAGRLAEARGWSADQLADRTVQTAGFDTDGVLRLSFGTREYTGRITDAFTIELRNDNGKVVKTPPSTPQGADEDTRAAYKEARAQLTASKKELKAVVELQTRRLREAMIQGRTWGAAEWREFVAEHPVMSRLAARVVWLADPGTPAQRAFRPDDGALVGVDDEDVTLDEADGGAGTTVGIAHAVTLTGGNGGADTPDAWREHLADYEVEPLFGQLGTALPETADGALRVSDRRGWLTDSYTVRGRLVSRGYTNGDVQDAGWFYEYTKEYPSAGLVAEIEFTGAFMGNENIPAAIKDLVFRRPGTYGDRGVVALADVPPVLLAETYADYLDVASAGAYDPAWERKAQY